MSELVLKNPLAVDLTKEIIGEVVSGVETYGVGVVDIGVDVGEREQMGQVGQLG
jgi:hypothetical protein